MTAEVTLRAGTPSDLAGLARVEDAAFAAEAWSRGQVAAELDQAGADRWVVVAAERVGPVGYAVGLVVGATAEVLRVAVHPKRRRAGIGRRLLGDVVEAAFRRGCTEVLLEAGAENAAALALYRSMGFTPVARRPAYYRAGAADAVVLRLGPSR